MKNYIRLLLTSLIAVFLLNGSAMAINNSYWHIVSENPGFEIINADINFEQLLNDDLGTFGFYVYNHILDQTFFSDLTTLHQYGTDHFVFNTLPGVNWWEILFTQNNSEELLNTYPMGRTTGIVFALVPEPAALLLLGTGLLGFAGVGRIKKNGNIL